MPSVFEAAWAARRGDMTAHFAEIEGFRLEPQAKPLRTIAGGVQVRDVNAASVPDPGRVATDFSAIFKAKGAVLHAQGRGMADSTTRPVVAESPMIEMALADAALLSDDVIVRARGGARYVVVKVVPQPFGRGLVHLVEAP